MTKIKFSKDNWIGEDTFVLDKSIKIGVNPFDEEFNDHPIIKNAQSTDEFTEVRRYVAEYDELGTYLVVVQADNENELKYADVFCTHDDIEYACTVDENMDGSYTAYNDSSITRESDNMFIAIGQLLHNV